MPESNIFGRNYEEEPLSVSLPKDRPVVGEESVPAVLYDRGAGSWPSYRILMYNLLL